MGRIGSGRGQKADPEIESGFKIVYIDGAVSSPRSTLFIEFFDI
jgi:hypothetical protein